MCAVFGSEGNVGLSGSTNSLGRIVRTGSVFAGPSSPPRDRASKGSSGRSLIAYLETLIRHTPDGHPVATIVARRESIVNQSLYWVGPCEPNPTLGHETAALETFGRFFGQPAVAAPMGALHMSQRWSARAKRTIQAEPQCKSVFSCDRASLWRDTISQGTNE
jgi:hypothetical protein